MARTAETTDYDPRYSRAQTVEGAKARYVSDDLPDYDEDDLERDVARVLDEGDYPDGRTNERLQRLKERAESRPVFEGQVVSK